MKKKLLALLLCLTMLLVMLPTVAMAAGPEEGTPEEEAPTTQFIVQKQVVLSGTGNLPGNVTFNFELKSKDDDKGLEDSGITLRNSLTINTTTNEFTSQYDGSYYFNNTITVSVVPSTIMSTGDSGWTSNNDDGYEKSFTLTEETGNEDGWTYDSSRYVVVLKYNPDATGDKLTCQVKLENDSAQANPLALFRNTYTANNSSIVIIVPETTEPEVTPNPTTGAAPANLGLGCVVIGLAAMGAVAYARKK